MFGSATLIGPLLAPYRPEVFGRRHRFCFSQWFTFNSDAQKLCADEIAVHINSSCLILHTIRDTWAHHRSPLLLSPMPPRITLLELATRRNIYVCRSCWTALGILQPTTAAAPARRFRTGHGPLKADDNHGESVKVNTRLVKPPQPTEETPAKGLVINYFEKDPKTGEITPIPRVPDAKALGLEEGDLEDDGENLEDLEIDELDDSITAQAEKIESTLRKLEKKQGGLLERIVAEHGPPGALEALKKVLASYGEPEQYPEGEEDLQEGPEDPDDMKLPEGAEDPDDMKGAEDAKQVKVEVKEPRVHLDESIRLGSYQRNKVEAWCERLEFWIRASLRIQRDILSRHHLNSIWDAFKNLGPLICKGQVLVSRETWDALWTIYSHEAKGRGNVVKMARIRSLYYTMINSGAFLSEEQHLLAIEAIFEDGKTGEALDTWKRLAAERGIQEESAATIDYWELGVRMFANLGDIARAERASKALFERASPATPADSRVLLHLLRAYLAEPDTAEKGFLLYRRMRDLATELGKPMDIGDFDDVIVLFLNSGHTDYAMYAFTDMMFAGTVNLYGKSKLPSHVKNSFFFGKWLKRLIGAGDLDNAYKVLVYMQKNGVMAASIQVNGLIGAWLRTGTVRNRAKAVKLADAMIRSRRAFVDLRERQLLTEWPMRLVDNRPDSSLSRQDSDLDYGLVPRASVETFVILAGNYRERMLFAPLERLFVAYKECQMPDDAMMMNELMMAAVAQNRGDKARELYQLMVHKHDILPSSDTFAILFSALEVNLLRGASVRPHKVAEYQRDVRSAFRDMLASGWVYAAKSKNNRLTDAHVRLILHSFRKTNDWAGLATALEGLRFTLGFRLTRVVVLEMLAEVEGIDRSGPTQRVHKAALRATVKLHELVLRHLPQGQRPDDDDDDDDAVTEGVKDPHVLYRILRAYHLPKLQQAYPKPGEAHRQLQQAREEMGLVPIVRRDGAAAAEEFERDAAAATKDAQPGLETVKKVTTDAAPAGKRLVGQVESHRHRRQRVFDK